MENLREAESKQCKSIESVRANIVKWHKFYEDKSRSVKEILFSLYFCYFFIDFALLWLIRNPNMNIDKSSEDEMSQNLKQWSKVSNIFFYFLLKYISTFHFKCKSYSYLCPPIGVDTAV